MRRSSSARSAGEVGSAMPDSTLGRAARAPEVKGMGLVAGGVNRLAESDLERGRVEVEQHAARVVHVAELVDLLAVEPRHVAGREVVVQRVLERLAVRLVEE